MIRIIRWRPAQDAEEISCPAFCCDLCGKHIDDVSKALYTWQVDAATYQPVSAVLTVHKQCQRGLRDAPGPKWMICELHELFDCLSRNARPVSQWKPEPGGR
jgi:hypothetical protein